MQRRGRDRSQERSYRSRSRSRSRDRNRERNYDNGGRNENRDEKYSTHRNDRIQIKGGKDKTALEQLRRERLELVKNITQYDSEQEQGLLKKTSKTIGVTNANGTTSFKSADEGGDDNDDGNDEDMLALMGFSGFDTSKNKPHEENLHSAAVGAVSKHKGRKYRQYMNRRGGFNRPLQKMD